MTIEQYAYDNGLTPAIAIEYTLRNDFNVRSRHINVSNPTLTGGYIVTLAPPHGQDSDEYFCALEAAWVEAHPDTPVEFIVKEILEFNVHYSSISLMKSAEEVFKGAFGDKVHAALNGSLMAALTKTSSGKKPHTTAKGPTGRWK